MHVCVCVYICICICIHVVNDSDRVFPKERKVYVGEDTQFLCHGMEGETVSWLRYNKRLPTVHQNRLLKLYNVSIEDYGEYTCVGYRLSDLGLSFSAKAYLTIIGTFLRCDFSHYC